jgi:hypothetical protein
MGLSECTSYTAVDLNLSDHITPEMQSNIAAQNAVHLVDRSFTEMNVEDLPRIDGEENKRLFLFMFNVFSYLPNPYEALQKVAEEGDVAIISMWNSNSIPAVLLRKEYYNYLSTFCNGLFNGTSVSSTNHTVNKFQQQAHALGADITRKKGYITDSLILRF